MPAYKSAEALLADASLRLDRFGPTAGILVVEGPDDKRLFGIHTAHRQQVIGAGGRRLLLAAHALAQAQGRTDVVFVTDCDYEVALQRLRPAPDLVITENADVESDLIALDGIERLAMELVPNVLESDEALQVAAEAIRTRSVAFAGILGVLRMIALEHGFEIDTSEVRHRKFRVPGTADVATDKLVRSVLQGTTCPMDHESCLARVKDASRGLLVCNGHDLVRAVNHVLRTDFSVRGQSPEGLEGLLRHGIQRDTFLRWSVVRRIQRWEDDTGRQVLKS